MSTNSRNEHYPLGGSAGASAAAPRLSSGVDYSTWAPLFINWCRRHGIDSAIARETKDWTVLCQREQQWEIDAEEASIAAVLTPSSSSSSSTTKATAISPDVLSAQTAVRQLLARSKRAYGALFEAIPDELRTQVVTEEGYAFGLWKWLEKKFQSTEADNVGNLWSKWTDMRMESDETYDAYRARVCKLHALLAAAKEAITPSFFLYIMLDRLQPSYSQVVLALKTSSKLVDPAKVNWDEVATLISAHERSEHRGGEEKSMSATRPRPRHDHNRSRDSTSSTTNPRWNPQCYNCKQFGHIAINCQQKKSEQSIAHGKRMNEKEHAASAVTRGEDEGDDEFTFSAISKRPQREREHTFAEVVMGTSMISARRPTISAKPSVPAVANADVRAPILNRLIRPGEAKASRSVIPPRSQVAEASASVMPPSRFKRQSTDAALATTAWGIDTMASCHISGNKELFRGLKSCPPASITVADGTTVRCMMRGSVRIRVLSADKTKRIGIDVDDVYYHERFAANLLSMGTLKNLGWEMHITAGETFIITKGGTKVSLSTRDRVMVLETSDSERVYGATVSKRCTTSDDLVLQHERLAHMSFDRMITIMKNGTTTDVGTLEVSAATLAEARIRVLSCAACAGGKATRSAFGHSGIDKGASTIDTLHADSFEVRGASQDNRTEYGITVSDPHSSARWFAHTYTKDELTLRLISIIRNAQTQTECKVKRLYCDGGTEFINSTLKNFCHTNGTEMHYPPARTQQLNGVAERSVRTLKDGGRTLLAHSKMPKRFWADAIEHFIFVWNRTRVGKNGRTPFETIRGSTPSAKHFGVFGSDVWYHLPKKDRDTFDPKVEAGIYLGHNDTQNCAVVYVLRTGKKVKTRDVIFRSTFHHAYALQHGDAAVQRAMNEPAPSLATEDEALLPEVDEAPLQGGIEQVKEQVPDEADENDEDEIERIIEKRGTGKKTQYLVQWVGYPNKDDCTWQKIDSLTNAQEAIDEYEQGQAAPGGITHMVMSALGREQDNDTTTPERVYEKEIMFAVAAAINRLGHDAPETYQQAMSSGDKDKWQQAMDKEIASCEALGTWDRVRLDDLPHGANILPCKWVFKVKNDENGNVTEFKSRLTPKGFRQKSGVDYFEVFARTGMYKTMRAGLALTAKWDNELDQMDVPSAFLNADVDEDIYMAMPQGYEQDGFALKLKKSLYGLKQAPRNWYLLVSGFIANELGFTACVSDPCLFHKRSRSGKLMLLFLFVDDFQSSYHLSDASEWQEVKKKLVDRFRTKDMGPSTWILGMRIQRDRVKGIITLDQELYVKKALEKFGLSQCTTAPTPSLTAQEHTSSDDDDGSGSAADRMRYMEIVGTVLYATISTRIDIAHAVQRLTRHMQAPTKRNMTAAERVLRYLAGTQSMKLSFGRHRESTAEQDRDKVAVSAFADADWANEKTDRKSITGWIAMIDGDVVSWASKKQRTVAQSTCEAELYAEAAAINEVIWLRGLLNELGMTVESKSVVYGDNQSTIAISKNGVKSERTKHVDVKYHFVTETIESEAVELKWVESAMQQADILTKPLARPLFEKFREKLMSD